MRTVRLGDICDIVSGGTPSRSNPEFWQDGTIPWIKIGNIKGKHISEADEYVTQKGLDGSSAKILPKGTILYTIFATLGEVGILDIEACTNQAIAGITVRDPLDVQTEYLYYYLKSKKNYVNEIGRGVAQNNINISILRNFSVPMPKNEVQEEIVSVLSKAEAIISVRKQQLSALDDLIKARFVEMFGDPVSNPKGWPMPPIEDVVAGDRNALKAGPFGSALKKEYYVDAGYKIYGQEQVISGDPNYGDYYIDEERYKQLENCAVQAGDVLISLVGTYGKLLIMPNKFEPGIINPRLMKITFDKGKVNPYYFQHFFQSDSLKKALADNTHGGTMDILNLGIVRKIKMPLPPIELQNDFVAFVAQIDKSKSVIQKSLDETQLLFDSLMQKYFG